MHHPPISQSDFDSLHREASRAAARLWRQLALPRADLDDLRQELLADLIRRLPAFDPGRGTIGAFANVVLRHQASRIALRITRERKASGGALISLNAVDSGGRKLVDDLGEADSLPGWHRANALNATAIERNVDLTVALGRLTPRDRALCAAVIHFPINALVTTGFGSRAGLYRRLGDLRCVLAAHGLMAA